MQLQAWVVRVYCPAMSTSPVSSASLAIFLFILLPTFSSATSCPSELQCNSTEPIEIRPPFFVGTPGLDPACRKSINVSCGQLRSYPDLVTWFSSISCAHSNVTVFHSIFGVDKEVHQSIEPDERSLASCHASPRFEWILSFSEVGSAGQIPLVNFSVQSGSIRKYLLSLSDCVSPSPGGNMITFLCAWDHFSSSIILERDRFVTHNMKTKMWKLQFSS